MTQTSRGQMPRFSFCSCPIIIQVVRLGVFGGQKKLFMDKKKVIVISVLLNILFVLCVGVFVIHHRSVIKEKIQNVFIKPQPPEEETLSPKEKALANFNNEPLEAVNDSLMIGVDSTITCLFLGNSLTYHAVIDEEPAEGKRGLTATSVEKDYVHVLVKMIAENNRVNIKYSILNIAQFERTFTKYSFDIGKLALAENKQPDYLFVQIGENVAKDDITNAKKYEDEYIKLLSLFPNSKRIITIPFWTDKDKQYATTNVAINSDSYLVDISHLGAGTDIMNFSSSYKKYKKPGVGAHPGDYGMKNIARSIYATFNAIYESEH